MNKVFSPTVGCDSPIREKATFINHLWDKKEKKKIDSTDLLQLRPGQVGGQLCHCFADCTVNCKQVAFLQLTEGSSAFQTQLMNSPSTSAVPESPFFFCFPNDGATYWIGWLDKKWWWESREKTAVCYSPVWLWLACLFVNFSKFGLRVQLLQNHEHNINTHERVFACLKKSNFATGFGDFILMKSIL